MKLRLTIHDLDHPQPPRDMRNPLTNPGRCIHGNSGARMRRGYWRSLSCKPCSRMEQ